MLFVSTLLVAAASAQTALPDRVTVAPVVAQHPRQSEAAIIALKDGSLLLGWTDFYGNSGADHGPARIVGRISKDAGKTWGDTHTLIENDGGCNVMEVNFLRLRDGRIALFHCQKNSEEKDCRVMMRTSADEGKTWSGGKQMSPAGHYVGLTNGRSLRLKTGRILLEAWEAGDAFCYVSDDDGETWWESCRIKPQKTESYEPICIERKDGSVMMLLRTMAEGQYRSVSLDGGETWDAPRPTQLLCTPSPAALTRIPATGDLLVIWNHNPGANSRNPLTSAISRDEGETWEQFRNIESAPGDAWAYPAVTWVGDNALTTYFNYTGGLALQLRIIPAAWFYGK
jgi:predicted neuraminidase